jgi:DNA modification methylase
LIGDCKVNLLLTDPPYGIDIVKIGGGKSEDKNHRPSIKGEREQMGTICGHKIKPPTPFKRNSGNTRKTRVHKNLKEGGGQMSMAKLESPGVVQPRLYKPVIGDDKPFDPKHLLDLNVPSIIFGANNFAHELPNNHRWLVWFKKSSLQYKRNCFSDVELCWTNLKGKSCLMYWHSWSGMVRAGERKEELEERVHPTQKPVGLLEQMILEFTKPNDVVLDLYGGSGSTLIACEKTNRKCLIMELSKDYCEIIENRYWDYVGKGQTKLM